MRICYHKCVFATVANTHQAYLLPEMNICLQASLNGQFSNSNNPSVGNTRNRIFNRVHKNSYCLALEFTSRLMLKKKVSCCLSTALVFAKLLITPKHSGAVTQRMQYYIPPFLGHFNLTWKKKLNGKLTKFSLF